MPTAALWPQPAAPLSFPAAELPLEVLRCPLHPDAGPLHPGAGLAGSPGLVCPHCRHIYPVVGGSWTCYPRA